MWPLQLLQLIACLELLPEATLMWVWMVVIMWMMVVTCWWIYPKQRWTMRGCVGVHSGLSRWTPP